MADQEKPKRKPISEHTSAELYALDFAAMSPAERAEFRAELKEKPGHGPHSTAVVHRIWAEAEARWSDWIKDHPEDAERPPPAQAPTAPRRGEAKGD
jgi:hypothetical protein